ncbi:MAG: hypothetical protein ACI8UO_006693, partial [Verrucomicrobiales bacterium]
MRILPRFFLPLLLALVVSMASGQEFQRERADKAAEQLLEEKAESANWKEDENPVEGSVKARFHDLFSPNDPPAPTDDPDSHELMRRIDGMRGAKRWEQAGNGVSVETDAWREFLPTNADGKVVLNLKNSVELALLHSRTFQNARETLYLSALDVTGQRYRFDTRFSLTNSTTETARGGQRGSRSNSR